MEVAHRKGKYDLQFVCSLAIRVNGDLLKMFYKLLSAKILMDLVNFKALGEA